MAELYLNINDQIQNISPRMKALNKFLYLKCIELFLPGEEGIVLFVIAIYDHHVVV